MNIAIIGLGLMGASLAQALHGFKNACIIGADTQKDVCRQAVKKKVVAEAWEDPRKAIEKADLLIFCTYANHIPEIIKSNTDLLAPGLIISDICGVKNKLYSILRDIIPNHVDYIGLHPMAGKERDGFENADPAIYRNSGLIICPEANTREKTLQLMKELAAHIGASRVAIVTPEQQDEIIAYTSSLMHIASAGLCLDYHPDMTSAFTAGAFRDCTRIADINAAAWTELLLDNRQYAAKQLQTYIENLELFKKALENKDKESMFSLLAKAGDNKRKMLTL